MLTPYLSDKPEYLALLSRTGLSTEVLTSREKTQLILIEGGSVVWHTGFFDPRKIGECWFQAKIYRRFGRSLRLYLSYVKHQGGYPRAVLVRLPINIPPANSAGKTVIDVDGSRAEYPAAVRKARSSVQASENRSLRVHTPNRSSALRPSPQTLSSPLSKVVEAYDKRNVPPWYLDVTSVGYTSYSRSWTGVRTPGFGKLKSGRMPINPHSVTIQNVSVNRTIRQHHFFQNDPGDRKRSDIDLFTAYYTPPGAPSEHLSLARNKAIKRLVDNAESGIEANLAQDVAQIGQTVRLIGGNAKKITRSILQLKKGNLSAAISSLTAGRSRHSMPRGKAHPSKDLAENWLELQYGWKPLLKDIEGSLNALSKLQIANRDVHRVSSSARAESRTVTFFNGSVQNSGIVNAGKHFVLDQSRCRIGIRYKIDDHLSAFLAQTGFTNPVNLTWELLPFSFVADWFIPIGPFLETLSAWNGLQFMDGFQTQFTNRRVVSAIDYNQINPLNTNQLVEEHGTYISDFVKLDRIKLTSFPAQTFPELKNPFSVDHALNAVAILRAVWK